MTRKTIYLFIILILIGWGIVISKSNHNTADESPGKTYSGKIEVLHTPECSADLELLNGVWTIGHSKADIIPKINNNTAQADFTGLNFSGSIHNKSDHDIKKVIIRFTATGKEGVVPWESECSIIFKSGNPSTSIADRQKINKNEEKKFKAAIAYQESKHVVFDTVKIKLIEGF